MPTQGTTGAPQPNVAGIQPSGWTWLGPGNIGGRVRSLLVHPSTPTIMWAGGVDGGVWKTTNAGTSWFPLADFMANLAVSCLAMDPADPNTIYAGTGEGFYNFDAVQGAGIFKTSDGGTTWTQLPSTTSLAFYYVNRLAISPNNSEVILAATGFGIYRSTDGGGSWSQRYSTRTLDLHFNPNDATKCIAAGEGFILYSTDGGMTWSAASGITAAGRIETAYASSNPSITYASAYKNNGEVYRSSDGGQSYARVNTGKNYLDSQGWYDNAIWVDPTDANTLIVGGIDLWRSRNGGTTLTQISNWQNTPTSAHADHHVIVNHPGYNGVGNQIAFFGNDGGVYRVADVYTATTTSGWTELNNNLGITQFYGAAGNASSGTIVGGTQDNGTIRYTTTGGTEGWSEMYGGDGGFCAADPSNPNYFYGEYVYLQIARSANGGASASDISSGISDAGGTSTANFIAPFILDLNSPATMLAGGVSLWRTTNVKATSPAWTAIKSVTSGSSPISAIAVALGSSDIIWVGHNNGDIYRTANGTAASPTWTRADLGSPNLPNRYCSRITIDPRNSSLVYVTFGGFSSDNVWRTTDAGATWSSLSSALPSAPINSLVIAPSDSKALYVGTEVGVFASLDGGTTWSASNDGPANVCVKELFWVTNRLVAVTHGRGLFSIIPNAPVANFTASPTTGVVPLTVNFSNQSSDASTYSWDFGDGQGSSAANPLHVYNNAGTYTVALTAIGPGGTNRLTRNGYISVDKANATVVLANLNQIYDSTARNVSLTTSPPGLAVNLTYNGLPSAPTNVGSYTVIGTINDLNYQGSATNNLLVTFGGPYTGIDLTDPAQALADPDGDGVLNLLEYALGTDPGDSTDGNTGMTVFLMQDSGARYVALQFRQRNDTSGLPLQYIPEVSADRQSWFSDAAHVLQVAVTPLDSVFSSVTVRDLTPITVVAPRFIRVRVVSATADAPSQVWLGTATTIQGSGSSASKLTAFSQRMVLPVVYAAHIASLQGSTLVDTNATWVDGQFGTNGTRAYVELDNGYRADIANSAAASQTLTLAQSLTGVASVGDHYRVRPHFTIAGLFGTNNEIGLKSGPTPALADTIMLIVPETQQTVTIFYFDNGTAAGWYAADFSPASQTAVKPAQGMMVRRLAAPDLTLYLVGQPKTGVSMVPVLPGYNLLGTLKSLSSLTLAGLNIYTGDAATGIASGLNPAGSDNLLVLGQAGSVSTYFYYKDSNGNEGWLDAAFEAAAGVQIAPGSSFFISRKSPEGAFNWTVPAE